MTDAQLIEDAAQKAFGTGDLWPFDALDARLRPAARQRVADLIAARSAADPAHYPSETTARFTTRNGMTASWN